MKELFHVCFWLARTYARKAKPADGLAFDPSVLSRRDEVLKKAFVHLKAQQAELDAKNGELTKLLADKQNLDDELKTLRAEVAAARKAAEARPTGTTTTRPKPATAIIDLLLREAGWALDRPEDLEFRVEGMPNNEGVGFVDYVLWGADGKPLGLVEAKRTRKDARVGQQQAKLYADRARGALRPAAGDLLFQRLRALDLGRYALPAAPDRRLLQARRAGASDPAAHQPQDARLRKPINRKIVERPYQQRAIRAIARAFEQDGERKALLVMATGSGKTRTVIALVDLLMRAGWVKRVLFLADRVALVNQAAGAFKAHLPDAAPVNLVTERTSEGRVFLSTYPTMMNLIDGKQEGKAKFGPGHFDLIVIDEAHRSVYQRFRAIFEYFDSLPRRADRDAEGRDRQEHLFAVRPRRRRADRRLFARRGGGRGLSGAAQGDLGAAQDRALRPALRRSERGGKRPVGHARMGRGGNPRHRRGRRGQQAAVQRGHGRSASSRI